MNFISFRITRIPVEPILYFFFLLAHITLHGQKSAREILALPATEQVKTMWDWSFRDTLRDTTVIEAYFKQLETDFTKLKHIPFAKQAWLMRIHYKANSLHYYDAYGVHIYNVGIEQARDRGWVDMEAECYLRKGLMYYAQGRYELAFEFIQKGYTLLRTIGFEHSLDIIRHLEEIGSCYYEFGDYPGAIQFLREALQLASASTSQGAARRVLNTLALCYMQTEQYDTAVYYFNRSYEESVIARDTFWAALSNGNKGHVFYLQGKYDDAIPLMENDFEKSIQYNVWPSAANAAMGLATMYLTKGNLEKTQFYLDFAGKHINYWNLRDVSGYYKNLAIISRLKGDFNNAFRYIDSSQVYKDKYVREKNIKTINQAKLKLEVEQHANQIRLLESVRSRQVLIRNGLLLILLLTGISVMLFIHQQRQKRAKERQLAELQQRAVEAELENAKKQLITFTNALREKNELVEKFSQEIDHFQQNADQQHSLRTEQLEALMHATILTEEDWKEFRLLFEKVYPGFFVRLREKFNDLSPAETRLLALTKLQLAPKEMAAMLGISYDAIKKSRQRLRRKIHLPEEGSLDELVDLV